MACILLVEDSPTVRFIVSKLLTDHGYEVITAGDGEEAVKVAQDKLPGLIILDVILPKLNGYQVCRLLKASVTTGSIPVVMLTSKWKDSDRQWGIEQGADAYLIKPFEDQALFDIVSQFVPQGR